MPRPPLPLVLAYRLLGWRLGPAWKDWVLDDLGRKGWLVRAGAPVLAVLLLLGSVTTAAVGGDSARMIALLAVIAGVGAFLRNTFRERALRQQGIDASGEPLELAPWYHDDQARLRRNVVSAVSTVLLVVVGLLIVALRSRP